MHQRDDALELAAPWIGKLSIVCLRRPPRIAYLDWTSMMNYSVGMSVFKVLSFFGI